MDPSSVSSFDDDHDVPVTEKDGELAACLSVSFCVASLLGLCATFGELRGLADSEPFEVSRIALVTLISGAVTFVLFSHPRRDDRTNEDTPDDAPLSPLPPDPDDPTIFRDRPFVIDDPSDPRRRA